MKTFRKFLLLLAFTIAFNVRAATNDVASFSGTVTDAQGNPVADASVDCYQYPKSSIFGPMDMEAKQHATTDGQGAFEFPAFRGRGVVLITKAGLAPCWLSWHAAPQEAQKIVLSASSTLAGVVVDDAGRPVADAEVWVTSALNKTTTDIGQPNFLFGKITRDLFSTRTSADGKFRIENFPADAQASLLVKKAGMAMHLTSTSPQYDQLPYHAGQEDIALTLDPAGTITGKVIARESGQPLASAVVSLKPTVMGMAYFLFDAGTIVSAADGSFQIPDVPAGSHQVMVNFTNQPIPDWVADPVPVTIAAGQTVPDVQLKAYKGAVVEVTVRGKENHEPIADATVSANTGNDNRSSSTESNGVACFRLPPGSYNFFASKQDWSQAQTQATVTEGETTQVTIDMPAPLKISGIGRDTSGAPVAGASVGVFPNFLGGDSGAKTDANGHYELSWQKPYWAGMQNQSYHLVVRHSERNLAAIQDIDETTTSLDMTLKPAMSLSGRVLDTDGKAVTNVVAFIVLQEENSSFSVSRQPIHSDGQGHIQVETLPRGERYGLSVSAHGYGSAHVEMDAADPNADHYDFPTITVNIANRKLAGRVLGTTGAPVAGVQIQIHGDGQPNGNVISDADGRFVFDAVCDGAVSLSANMKGAFASAQAMGGDTNVVLRFDSGNKSYYQAAQLKLNGTVYDPAGNPAIGAVVVVTPNFGQIDIARTDTNGDYFVNWRSQPGMPGAKYFVIARDINRNLAAIEAIDTNKTGVDLRLEPALSISGTVQDAKGAPMIHANVNLSLMAGNMGGMVDYHGTKINSDGTFTIPALPMGQKYNVYVMANGYGSAQKQIGIGESKTGSVQLSPFNLKTADLLLAGQVVDAKNKPMSGVQVNIYGNGQPNGNVTTDATGHFKFKVCDGPININAWAPSGAGRNNYGNAQARGGDTKVVVKLGVPQQERPVIQRANPLKPQLWTLSAIKAWPAQHRTGTMILLSLQGAALLGTGGGIFLFALVRGRRIK